MPGQLVRPLPHPRSAEQGPRGAKIRVEGHSTSRYGRPERSRVIPAPTLCRSVASDRPHRGTGGWAPAGAGEVANPAGEVGSPPGSCADPPVDTLAKQVDMPTVLGVLSDHPEHEPAEVDVLVPIQRPRGVVEVMSGDDLAGHLTLRAPGL